MYDLILQTKTWTFIGALVAAFLACLLAGDLRKAPRAVLHNYAPSFACGFFLVAAFYDVNVRAIDLATAFAFEFCVLLAYCRLLIDALQLVRHANSKTVDRWLRWTLLLSIGLAWPLLLNEGFGVFSAGSRIDYLGEGGAPLYLTYAGLLAGSVQAGLLAQRISLGRSVGAWGLATIAVNLTLSLLAGSKGSTFLWFASVLALVDYQRVRVRWPVVIGTVTALGAALWLTASFVSGLLGISKVEFAELASARFFLNNDARALALDLGGGVDRLAELPESSFRGLYSRLGHEPSDPPLGVMLYQQEFGNTAGTGANSSAIALIQYYSLRSYSLVPVFFAVLGLAGLYGCIVGLRYFLAGRQKRLVVTLAGILLVQTFSQDFLAFQVLLPIVFVMAAFLLLTNQKRTRDHFQRLHKNRRLAVAQHSDSSPGAGLRTGTLHLRHPRGVGH